MESNKDRTTEAQVDAAYERAKSFDRHPRVLSARYEPSIDAFVLKLTGGHRFFVPREDLRDLAGAAQEALAEIEIHAGLSLAWPRLDVDYYFPHIFAERVKPEHWYLPEHTSATLNAETSQVAA